MQKWYAFKVSSPIEQEPHSKDGNLTFYFYLSIQQQASMGGAGCVSGSAPGLNIVVVRLSKETHRPPRWIGIPDTRGAVKQYPCSVWNLDLASIFKCRVSAAYPKIRFN